jgi:hypothetical protein
MDFITGLPKSVMGFDAIFTVVDSLTKMAHFIPTTTTASTQDVIELFVDRIVRYHGIPLVIVSDRDARFVSAFWEGFCKRFGIKRALSSAWHPQSDGQTERANRTIEQMLRTYIQTDEAEWPKLLPALELAYNCTPHSSTGLSPFEILIGENPIREQDLDIVERLPYQVTPPMTKSFQQLVDRAYAHIEAAKQRQKDIVDKHRREVEFQIGDKVWLSTRNMPPRGCAKFHPRYMGPFPILEKIGKVAYKLQLPPTMLQHPVFHVSLLSKYVERPEGMQAPENEEQWLPISVLDESQPQRPRMFLEYEAEHILDERGEGSSLQYLVKWKGFPDNQATWEPAAHLTNCSDLMRAFKIHKARQQRSSHNKH